MGAESDAPSRVPDEDYRLAILALEQHPDRAAGIDECLAGLESTRSDAPRPRLADLLAERGIVTRTDLEPLLKEAARRAQGLPKLSRYAVLDRVGEGATSLVYRARDPQLKRLVAVKILRQAVGLNDQARHRFHREARAAAAVAHPGLVAVHDAGEENGLTYIVMELVAGRPFGRFLRDEKREITTLVAILERAARAVAAAHARGVVHRDIKPDNILVTASGEPKVADFGLAHLADTQTDLTRSGMPLGTPLYMSPEQAQGRAVSPRSDVYAFGAVLYEILAGRPPHLGENMMELCGRILRDDPVRPRVLDPMVPAALETVALAALEKDPARRYPSALEFADELARWLQGKAVVAQSPGLWHQAKKWARRHPTASVVAALSLLLVVLVVAGALRYAADMDAARRHAEDQMVRARVAEADSRKQRLAAEEALAASYVSQGDALGAAGRWDQARRRFAEGRDLLLKLRRSTLPADLGIWDADRHHRPDARGFKAHLSKARVAISPDGKRVASGGFEGVVRLWDGATGRDLGRLKGHRGTVSAVAFSPDGRRILSGGVDKTVRLWDAGSAEPLRLLSGHENTVGAVAFSPDGKAALSGSNDGTLRLWPLDPAGEARTLGRHAKEVYAVAFSPDGREALSAGNDGTALWDLASGARLRSFAADSWVHAAAFSPDARTLITASQDSFLRIWARDRDEPLRTLAGHAGPVHGVACLPGGRRALSGSADGTLKLWDLESGRVLETWSQEKGIVGLSVSPSGRLAASGGEDGSLCVWSLEPGRQVQACGAHPQAVTAAAFSADGLLAVSAGGGEVRVSDAGTGRLLRSWPEPTVRAAALSPDGRWTATGSGEGLMTLRETAGGRELRSIKAHGDAITTLAWMGDGRRLISAGNDKTVKAWDPETGAEAWVFKGHGAQVRGLDLRTGLGFSAGEDRGLALWDPETGISRQAFDRADQKLRCAALSADGRRALSGGGALEVWDARSGRALRTLTGHTGPVNAVAFAPDGAFALSGGEDRSLRVWDTETGTEARAFSLPAGVTALAFAPRGRRALVGRLDGAVEIWDFASPPQAGSGPADLGRGFAARGAWALAAPALRHARDAGAAVGALEIAWACWQEGDLDGARAELGRARAQGEAPPSYLDLCDAALGRP